MKIKISNNKVFFNNESTEKKIHPYWCRYDIVWKR